MFDLIKKIGLFCACLAVKWNFEPLYGENNWHNSFHLKMGA